MTQRDWQKDMDLVQGTIKHDAFPAWTEPMLYWLQEAKELQEIVSGRGRELLRLRSLLGGLNDELTATEDRADAAEAREQEIKRAIGRCLVAGNSLGSIIMNYNLPEGHEEWSYQEANSYFFGKFYNDRPSAYESYETWLAWKAIMGVSEIMTTLYPDTPAPKEGSHD
ncbi:MULTISPECIES: hypothetical protein [Paenibacillus]|uniref:hypothetical protein n=1 Tax=Paenibacillus TaxID=44249 RepID=UPI00096C34AB|nr:hypothetical protein [Paenibacillus odorifer]OME18742.1 hypothetical protein BSK60_01500 [Paenibacillus odorifer]OME62271.1 hypothetical protein BSK59_02035 [Paenibacillus odorifer]